VARCANTVIMSEEGRLAMSGPEVIETANGVEEFDSRDRALVWRTTGGKHRYLIGDCQQLVSDDIDAFRTAAIAALSAVSDAKLTLSGLEAEQEMLRRRIATFGHAEDPMDIWAELGVARPETVPMLEAAAFTAMAERLRIVSKA